MKSNQSLTPIEATIPLLEPVRTYTAKELAVMPRSRMLACIEAQEAFYLMEHTTKMGGQAIEIRRQLEEGVLLIQVKEKSRTRYKVNGEFIAPRIIRQLEKRGLVKLGGAKK